jgi:hypothetical protein
VPKPRYKTTNWKQCNEALINHGSLTFWIDVDAIAQWKAKSEQPRKGCPRIFRDLAITTALMVKRVFSIPLRALQVFINSMFKLADIPFSCPHTFPSANERKPLRLLLKRRHAAL